MRYPLVEIGTGALFVALAILLAPDVDAFRHPADHGGTWLAIGVALVVTAALVALSLIDLDYRILPDEITKTGIWIGPVLAFLAPGFQHGRHVLRLFGETGWGERGNAAVSGVLGVFVAGGTLRLIGWAGSKAFKKDAMGLGDVKMIAGMGGVLGLWALLALAVAAMLGSIVGLAVRVITRGRYIPFGPFLAAGMLVVMVRGGGLLDWWIGLMQPR